MLVNLPPFTCIVCNYNNFDIPSANTLVSCDQVVYKDKGWSFLYTLYLDLRPGSQFVTAEFRL